MTQPPTLSYACPVIRSAVGRWRLVAGLLAAAGLAAAVVIAGLLVLVARVNRGGGEARRAGAQTQVQDLSAGRDRFVAEIGRYPTTAEGLAALSGQPAGLCRGEPAACRAATLWPGGA